MKNFKFSSSASGKVFRNGLYSTAILAAAIVLAVLINLLVGAIPKKYTEFDLSAAKMYTLGDSSRQLMQSLDQDVTVYYLCETGSEDAIITKLLDHYADESGHFHWEQKDPALYPTFAAQYGAENASTGSLIVVSGENSEVLNAAELYEYDYSDYYTTGAANVTFGGEKQISSAIYKLTAAAESHAYYTTNHGEQALTSSLTEALKAQVGADWAKHIIAVADHEKGNLIKLAKENGFVTFYIPDGVGGRFSEMCPVGLVPAACCGIDIRAMLKGAAAMDERCKTDDMMKNPALLEAVLQYIAMQDMEANIQVVMPCWRLCFSILPASRWGATCRSCCRMPIPSNIWRTGSASCGRSRWARTSAATAAIATPVRPRLRRWA